MTEQRKKELLGIARIIRGASLGAAVIFASRYILDGGDIHYVIVLLCIIILCLSYVIEAIIVAGPRDTSG